MSEIRAVVALATPTSVTLVTHGVSMSRRRTRALMPSGGKPIGLTDVITITSEWKNNPFKIKDVILEMTVTYLSLICVKYVPFLIKCQF